MGELEVTYIIKHYIKRNKELITDMYNINGKGGVFNPPSCALFKLSILGPVRLPGATTLWDTYFPDHCPGETVFFAALIRKPVEWAPAIVIACSHWEYGGSPSDFCLLQEIVDVIGVEAFNYRGVHAEIVYASESEEKLLAIVEPDTLFEPPKRRISKAIRKFHPRIRAHFFNQENPARIPWKAIIRNDRISLPQSRESSTTTITGRPRRRGRENNTTM